MDDNTFETESTISIYLPFIQNRLEQELYKRKHPMNNSSNLNSRLKPTYIHKLEIKSHTPLYGYFTDKKVFIKVLLKDPNDIKLVMSILESGVLGTMQAYGGHIPYLLQFTNDFNILPMNWLMLNRKLKV